jgi:plastocyanin
MELDSPSLLGATAGSQNYIHTFAHAGLYPYHCEYHTTASHRMAGTVTVDDTGQDSAFVSIFQGAFQPASVVVRPGGQVRWQNFDDGVHHTVTSD